MKSLIEWPEIGEDACQHFTVFALFGDIDPRNVRTKQTPASELKSRVIAAGTEPDTFARIQPIFRQDDKLALILEMTRKGYFDGKPPEDLSTLPELLRRTETFIGDDCKMQVVGDYFLSEWEAPEPLRIARGPFGTQPSFKHVTGVMQVEGSDVQQIQWAFREDSLWKITLSGWIKNTLAVDVLRTTLASFHETFRSLRDAQPLSS